MQAALKALAAAAAPRCAGSARACTAYVTKERDISVSVVDLDQMKTVEAVPVGQRPHGITGGVPLAPVGTQNLGRNQVLNDKGRRPAQSAAEGGRAGWRAAGRSGTPGRPGPAAALLACQGRADQVG